MHASLPVQISILLGRTEPVHGLLDQLLPPGRILGRSEVQREEMVLCFRLWMGIDPVDQLWQRRNRIVRAGGSGQARPLLREQEQGGQAFGRMAVVRNLSDYFPGERLLFWRAGDGRDDCHRCAETLARRDGSLPKQLVRQFHRLTTMPATRLDLQCERPILPGARRARRPDPTQDGLRGVVVAESKFGRGVVP